MNKIWAAGYLINFLMGMEDEEKSEQMEIFIEAIEESIMALLKVIMEEHGDIFSEETKEQYNKIMEVYKARESISERENNWAS